MYFLYLVLGISILLYVRFLILRTFLSKENFINGLKGAAKLAYFSPLFFQGLLLLWFALRNFRHICQGFVYCFRYWLLRKEDKPDYDFLFLVSYLGIGALVLGIHAAIGRLSLNRKVDPLHIFFKVAYIFLSFWLVKISIYNVGLFHPIAAQLNRLMFYDNGYVIAAGMILYFSVLLQLRFAPAAREIRFMQIGVLTSTVYLIASISLAFLLFLVYATVKWMA